MRTPTEADVFLSPRYTMVELQLRARGIRDERVLAAMRTVPRHEFVAAPFRNEAYGDHPLPIGEGQTVSQPYIVALTLEALALEPEHRVLEIGTGSGYQAALLAALAGQVFSVERHATLAQVAGETLARLGCRNVIVVVGDGTQGLPAAAPFDAIAVSAAAPDIPPPLFEQLKEGGRMVVPVGSAVAQDLQLVRKQDGRPQVSILEACRFVPLVGAQGFARGW
jgi:protein-L-isoaspartate(D-aspartate) O-methyltransferase